MIRKLIILFLLAISILGCSNSNQHELMSSVQDNNLVNVRKLLAQGEKPDFFAADDWTPLTIAAKNGKTEMVKLLLQHGADVDLEEGGGNTPLFWALFYEHPDTVLLLIRNNADPCKVKWKDGAKGLALSRKQVQLASMLPVCNS